MNVTKRGCYEGIESGKAEKPDPEMEVVGNSVKQQMQSALEYMTNKGKGSSEILRIVTDSTIEQIETIRMHLNK